MTSLKTGSLRVLIVDDSRISRTKMIEMLKIAGFPHLDEAKDAAEADAKMEAQRYDIVFLDWVMPGKSGVSLLEQWRVDKLYRDVAVIVVSAESEPKAIVAALKAGAISYIVKPVAEAVLKDNITKTLAWLEQCGRFKEAPV
jgi:DNA-binding response OmpR family regulator